MSTQPEQQMSLSERTRAEIRAEMGRQMLSQKGLAARLGEGQPWVSRRLFGATPITLEDLERIAQALGRPDPTSFSRLPRLDSNQQPAGSGKLVPFARRYRNIPKSVLSPENDRRGA